MVEGDWCAELGVIYVVSAGFGLSVFNVGSRFDSLSVGRSLKAHRCVSAESGVLDVVITRLTLGLMKADLCSPARLCRGAAAGFAASSLL